MPIHCIVPTFNKSIPNKVHNDLVVTGQNTVSLQTSSWSYFSAISTESIPATVDGEYAFAVRIDNIGLIARIMIGVTSTETFDSNKESLPGLNGMTGCALDLSDGNYFPGHRNIIDAKITDKAKEVIVVVTISPGRLYGHNCSIRWIVDGTSSPNHDCTADCEGDKLFLVVSMQMRASQITTIPIDQVTIRNREVNKLIESFLEQSSPSANNTNQQQSSSAAFAQLQQELEKERKRADLAESQLQQERQNSAAKDQVIQQKDAEIIRLRQLLNP